MRVPAALLFAAVFGAAPVAAAEPWREAFLVLSTGQSSYRSLHENAIAVFRSEGETAVGRAALEHDPLSPREGPALGRIAENLGPAAAGPLLRALDASDTDARRASILFALSWTRDSSSASRVEPWLAWPDVRVRAAACAALGDLGTAASLSALSGALGDTEPAVRRIAADALGRIVARDPTVRAEGEWVTALESARADPDAWVRRAAARTVETGAADADDPAGRRP